MGEQNQQEMDVDPFAELLERLSQEDPPEQASGQSRTGERVEQLITALVEAAGADWPTVEELRQLPPDDFANLSRQLSLVIDRLTALRVDLLGGRSLRPL